MHIMTRAVWLTAIAGLAAMPATAQMAGMDHDKDAPVAGGGKFPAGWAAKTDRNMPLTNVKFEKMGTGYHFTMGGVAAVVYDESNKASGNYHAVATFTQTKPPAMGHAEGYGLFVGGKDLQGAATYTYFLVRQDGQFIIKQFTGGTPGFVTPSWTANAAVNKADANGKQTNELAIGISGGKASFTVNGKEVFSTDAAKISTDGVVGFRVNHFLDVHVDGFAIHKM